jgi:hypothetical protein
MALAGTSAMMGPDLDPLLDDNEDLPRTLRREKEARAREARERAAQERAAAPSLSTEQEERPRPQIFASADMNPAATQNSAGPLVPASLRAIDVPFAQLTLFFLKAVIAAIPALILLGAIMWMLGNVLEMIFPWLIKMKILISFPN